MKVNFFSDLHLEFGQKDIKLPGGDVLIMAGDIFNAFAMDEKRNDAKSRTERNQYIRFLENQVSKYTKVFYVLGNHDFYKGQLSKVPGITKEFIAKHASNVSVLDNEAVCYEGVNFIGSTLWTPMGANNGTELVISRGMNDFNCIFVNERKNSFRDQNIRPWDLNRIYQESVKFINKSIRYDSINIVITHHAPSFASADRVHGNYVLDGAYCSDLSEFILNNPIHTWIHGHTHFNVDYSIGKTRIVTNQAGYPEQPTRKNFKPDNKEFVL